MKIKVKDLIETLQTMDPEALVVIAKDAEGNYFSPLSGAGEGQYQPDSTWSGNFTDHPEDLDPSLPNNAVCLWPVN